MKFGGLAEWILREGRDEHTHRFMITRPGTGKRKDNSDRAKFLRWFEKHPATRTNRRKKHGRQ